MENLSEKIDALLILQGKLLASRNLANLSPNEIHNAEFKVFSQFGEDGIIQYLIEKTKITLSETIFIEFGVQNYIESNTRFLIMNNNWKGLVIDGSENNINFIKQQNLYWRHDISAINAWINRDNINNIIASEGFSGSVGILSIDIDGNDYWVWEKIQSVDPIIVIIEYNSLFGGDFPVTTPYDPDFLRENAHYSHLYWGASIGALTHLGEKKGYKLICSNSAGNNLFFVKADRLGEMKPQSASEAYVECRFRESRDTNGNLNYLKGLSRQKEIENLPLVNVVTNEIVSLKSLSNRF